MVIIFFFYGLAFLAMGAVIILLSKKNDFLGLNKDFWLLSLFGFSHGLNEWVDLFILRGYPFNVEALTAAGAVLLPISYVFLLMFGVNVLVRQLPYLRRLKFLWLVCLSAWIAVYLSSHDFLFCGIFSRYFIGLPGSLIVSFAMSRVFLKSGQNKVSNAVSLSVLSIIITFFIYGILTGLVVPQANFFPASVINYASFTAIFGLPVQFFRMLCAIALAISFFIITGIFYYRMGSLRFRGGIKRRTAFIISSVALLVTIFGVGLEYFLGHRLLYNTVIEGYSETTAVAARCVERVINTEIRELKIRLSDSRWIDLLKESNLKYSSMPPEVIKGHFLDMDRQWLKSGKDSALIKSYLETSSSLKLKQIADEKSMAEIFITDASGALVAASGKTSDFYQADEAWWQESFAGGKGKVFTGNIEFDESSGIYGITLALPIRDNNNKLIGICKAVVDLDTAFKPLWEVRLGEAGRVVIIDEKSRIIFRSKNNSSGKAVFYTGSLDELLAKPRMFNDFLFGKGAAFMAYTFVKQPQLSDSPASLIVCAEDEMAHLFTPLYRFIIQMSAIALLMLLAFICLGFSFGKIFTAPILKLKEAVDKISAGDLRYRVELKTGDEIEELAYSFNKMAGDLDSSMKNMRLHEDRLTVLVTGLAKANEELKIKTEEALEAKAKLISVKKELEDKITALEQFNKVAVDRELKMRELKEKVRELEDRLK